MPRVKIHMRSFSRSTSIAYTCLSFIPQPILGSFVLIAVAIPARLCIHTRICAMLTSTPFILPGVELQKTSPKLLHSWTRVPIYKGSSDCEETLVSVKVDVSLTTLHCCYRRPIKANHNLPPSTAMNSRTNAGSDKRCSCVRDNQGLPRCSAAQSIVSPSVTAAD